MEAGSELTLKVGGSFVKLDASGVTLVGAQVKINSGGSAGTGSGAKPILPGPIEEEARTNPKPTSTTPESQSVPLEALLKQSLVFRQTKKGICEVCEAAKTAEEPV
ncbi:hypothetical protein D3C77_638090 [compost metagenome]